MRGRPGPPWAVPSYFWAISFRCHANGVSNVTMLATSASNRRPSRLALGRKTPSLIVVEPKPSAAKLFFWDSILFVKANCCCWLIHPATEISKNRNGSRTLCVFKAHYRELGVETLEAKPYQ